MRCSLIMFLCPIVGSFSTGAAANPTVAMMEAAFANEQLDWRYVNCEVAEDGLGAAVAGARAMGWQGFNCSIPHKQAVIPLLDGLAETAHIAHAVNCVVRTDTGWFGHNTDGLGFLESARQVIDPTGLEVLVIGSGGAAYAIAIEVARAGARRVHIASRNSRTATALARLVTTDTEADGRVFGWTQQLVVPPAVRLVVNATPVGMSPHADQIRRDRLGFDPDRCGCRRRRTAAGGHPFSPSCEGGRSGDDRRPWNARQSSGREHPPLDRRATRHFRDALCPGRRARARLTTVPVSGRRRAGHDRDCLGHRVRLRCDDGDSATEPLDVDAVGDLEDVGHVVADQDHRQPAFAKVADQLQNLPGFPDTECGRRFVEDHDLAAERCGPGHSDGLTLTARQRLDGLGDVLQGSDTEIIERLLRIASHPWRVDHAKDRPERTPARRRSRPRNMLVAMSSAGATASVW